MSGQSLGGEPPAHHLHHAWCEVGREDVRTPQRGFDSHHSSAGGDVKQLWAVYIASQAEQVLFPRRAA
jgi:hypothetical protein